MRILIPLLSLFVILQSCKNENKKELAYTINLTATGFEENTKFEMVNLSKLEVQDSSLLKNGKLQFKGSVEEPYTVRIKTVDNKALVVWLENETIDITADDDNFSQAKITGSKLNEVMTKYRDKQASLQAERNTLMQKIMTIINGGGDVGESISKINEQIANIDQGTFKMRLQSILDETPSFYTMNELYFLRNDFSKDSLQLLFDKFPASLQNTKYGEVIKTYLESKALAIGDKYIDIYGKDEQGQNVKLSSLEGKYVLLDFWASWCGPCRQENPNLVKAYELFREKGFEIYSFSIDNNSSSWKEAVQKDSLRWTNVIDEKGSYSKMSARYGVRAIPASFLINPEGVIIAKNLRGDKLKEKLEKEL